MGEKSALRMSCKRRQQRMSSSARSRSRRLKQRRFMGAISNLRRHILARKGFEVTMFFQKRQVRARERRACGVPRGERAMRLKESWDMTSTGRVVRGI